jgi:WD40 repeat protein
LSFFPDGNQILTGSDYARIWDINGDLIQTFGQGQISSVAISSDGQWLAAAYYDKQVELYDAKGNPKIQIGGESTLSILSLSTVTGAGY